MDWPLGELIVAIGACAECGKDVSSKAKVCPHCGLVFKRTSGCAAVAALCFGAGLLLVALAEMDTPRTPESPPTQAQVGAGKVYVAKMDALAALKDPDSARFGTLRATYLPEGRWIVCGEVNSKNAFGGYVGMSKFVWYELSRTVLLEEHDRAGFAKAWNSTCAKTPSAYRTRG